MTQPHVVANGRSTPCRSLPSCLSLRVLCGVLAVSQIADVGRYHLHRDHNRLRVTPDKGNITGQPGAESGPLRRQKLVPGVRKFAKLVDIDNDNVPEVVVPAENSL